MIRLNPNRLKEKSTGFKSGEFAGWGRTSQPSCVMKLYEQKNMSQVIFIGNIVIEKTKKTSLKGTVNRKKDMSLTIKYEKYA